MVNIGQRFERRTEKQIAVFDCANNSNIRDRDFFKDILLHPPDVERGTVRAF